MTTICANNRVMVSDRMIDSQGTKTRGAKIQRVNRDIIGVAGDISLGTLFIRMISREMHVSLSFYENPSFLEPSRLDIPSHLNYDDFEALILSGPAPGHPYTRLYWVDSTFIAQEVPFNTCIGSGKPYVEGALAAGADIETAVRIATRLDVHSGYGLHAVELMKEE